MVQRTPEYVVDNPEATCDHEVDSLVAMYVRNGNAPPGGRPVELPRGPVRRRGPRLLAIAGAALIAVLVLLLATADFWANWLWFGSVGLRAVLLARYLAQGTLFAVGGIVAALFFGFNVRHAGSSLDGATVTVRGEALPLPRRAVGIATAAGSVLIGLIFGMRVAGNWQTVLAFLHRQDNHETDVADTPPHLPTPPRTGCATVPAR